MYTILSIIINTIINTFSVLLSTLFLLLQHYLFGGPVADIEKK